MITDDDIDLLKKANQPCPEWPDCADDEGRCWACASHDRLNELLKSHEIAEEASTYVILKERRNGGEKAVYARLRDLVRANVLADTYPSSKETK